MGRHERVSDDSITEVILEAGQSTTADLILKRAKPPGITVASGHLFDFQQKDIQAFDQFVEKWMEYFFIPGASIALVKDGKIIHARPFGVKNGYTGDPVTKDTVFEAASITKIVFAFAVNRLAERGIIDLDKPLYTYHPFTDLEGDARYKLMTARHVLTHRTGLPNWRSGQIKLAFTPGEKHKYSGEGFEYLKRVVVAITGKTIEEILMEEVQIPMGFTKNTFFKAADSLGHDISHGHSVKRPYVVNVPKRTGVAHTMHTNAASLANFMVALLERKSLKSETYDQMLSKVSESPILPSEYGLPWPSGFGLGFAFSDTPYGQSFAHGGNNGDFHAWFEAFPDQNAGFVVMANNERAWAFGEVIRRYLIAGADVPSTAEKVAEKLEEK